MGAIDIHHHYVPGDVIGEAKRHGKALGIEVSEDNDGTIRFSFNGGPRYPLLQGLTDEEPRLEMMERGKIALAALDPSTQLLGYDLRGEQAESWCRLYNECVREFLKKYPDRFTAMAAVPIQEPERAARVLEHAVTRLDFRGAYIATNVNHRYYDSTDCDPFWAQAQELDVLVFMHPDNPAGTELMGSFGVSACVRQSRRHDAFPRHSHLQRRVRPVPQFSTLHLSRRRIFSLSCEPLRPGIFTGQQATRRADRPNAPRCTTAPSAYLKNLYFDTLVYDVETLDFLICKRRGAFNAWHRLSVYPR